MSERMSKISELAHRVLSEEIAGLKDPRIGFVTVTSVKVTSDLRHARVRISVLGTPGEVAATMAGLESARSHLRFELGRKMRIKYLPELTFELDTQAEEAQRLERLFRKLHADAPSADDAAPEEEPAEGGEDQE